jgi:tRNA(His) 5'-end guanylyltransferase
MGDLASRMKGYEEAARLSFPKRLPLIIRVDGKAFSKLTQNLKHNQVDPFNREFIKTMNAVAVALCVEIQGAQLAYVQSDEVSILVHGYKKFESQPWFDNQLQKIVSVAASIAAATFTINSLTIFEQMRAAFFDARAFVLPEHEVTNYMLWRQQDAMRNSVQMLARHHFSHKECDNKSCEMMKTMLSEKNIKWDDLPIGIRQGRCVKKSSNESMVFAGKTVIGSSWSLEDSPLFVQNREYIDQLLLTEKMKNEL